ncbi:MAG: 4-(cytidine 5'-diphospho)-2-C-methyl-D-erythritol kinase [Burkholderiales bacterium]|nr:4-(cytidine 5'-diphospho)-2-C-methyl-D-erythritol kinase [Burkholderiales bacterium]
MNPGAPEWDREWSAPAKLNLFLHVVGRRPDGYHLLQTAFRLIGWFDRLRFETRRDARVHLARAPAGLAEGEELSVRAARLLQSLTGCERGVDIHLDKSIPVGGGLGGGSSDAATTLIALNRLWGLDLSRPALSAAALALGADVPFFLCGRNAFGEGIGERLTPLVLAPSWYLVLVPPVHVPTRAIFAAPDLTRNTKIITISSFSEGFGRNDLEPLVTRSYPVVAAHLAWLAEHAPARMSGSGCCVFARFDAEAQARSILNKMPAGVQGRVVPGLDAHPLAGFADGG